MVVFRECTFRCRSIPSSYPPNLRRTIIDHGNSGFVLSESKAIICYLAEMFDEEALFTISEPKEKALVRQWMYFQASGQGETLCLIRGKLKRS